LLAENLARNSAGTRQPALELYNCALSNRTGTGLLSEPPGFSRNRGLASLELVCGAVPSVQCEVDTLDNILGHRHVDLLKVDVEGHELSLLKGASESLAEGRIRNIVFEDHQGLSSEVCRTLRDFGYHVFPIGWNLKGPQVGPLVETKSWESSNFVATFAPEDTLRICNAPGWRMLR
jgi:FkbM family methyltransferase